MVKVTVTDEHFLKASAIACGGAGAMLMGWPDKGQDVYLPTIGTRNDTTARWLGLANLGNAALTWTASEGANRKQFLKVNGTAWGAAAALSAYNARKGHQKEKNTWPIAAGQAALAGLLLWRGFSKDRSV